MNDEKTNVMPGSDIDELRAYFPWENWGECFWGFTCFSRQNYADVVPLDAVDEIMLGVQCEGGAACASWQFAGVWLPAAKFPAWKCMTAHGRFLKHQPLRRL